MKYDNSGGFTGKWYGDRNSSWSIVRNNYENFLASIMRQKIKRTHGEFPYINSQYQKRGSMKLDVDNN